MPPIWIYGDESGTMPGGKTKGPFVAAVLVSPAALIDDVGQEFRSAERLVRNMAERDLRPAVACVRPGPGFGATWAKKASAMDTMARGRRLITGRHEYLPGRGFAARDYIWNRTMQQAVLQAVLGSVFRGPVSQVTVILHRKTLAGPTERFVRDRLAGVFHSIRHDLLRFRTLLPAPGNGVEGYLRNIAGTEVSFRWGTTDSEPGVRLAHSLAWLSHRQFTRGAEVGLFERLKQTGHRSFVWDVTDSLLQPLPEAAVERWRKDTGLPAPRI